MQKYRIEEAIAATLMVKAVVREELSEPEGEASYVH